MAEQKKKKIPTVVKIIAGLVVCYTALVLSSVIGKDTGPWEGRVLDIDTGEPIEGAVVLVVWYIEKPSIGGTVSGTFHRAAEVVTDESGYFFIPSYYPFNFFFITGISTPFFNIYKPGYFYVKYPSHKAFSKESMFETEELTYRLSSELSATYRISANRIELPWLLSSSGSYKEKSRILSVGRLHIPEEEMVLFTKAVNQGRVSIGLEPYSLQGDKK